MVVADPEATLLTACEKGYGKRTMFGANSKTGEEADEGEGDSSSGSSRYRTQKRGGKGLRDIKTTERNGRVIGVKSVNDDDELLLMTSRGKIQRINRPHNPCVGGARFTPARLEKRRVIPSRRARTSTQPRSARAPSTCDRFLGTTW